ncbi:MAG: CpXC domain-containing protein [Treponema sp.]|nr:CpXC domain-containing protein [Treponema sp.]
MKRKISCFCDNVFEADVPEEIDLDAAREYLDQIQNGTFLNFTCPGCGKKHKPEFPISVLWPSKQLRFEVFPEMQRGDFYRQKKGLDEKNGPYTPETIIGYPELADRLAVLRDGFDPVPVEAIKYFLHLKAEDQYPDGEMDIWYSGSSGGSLTFHIHGIRQNEVAVMKVPLSLYEKTLDDYKKQPKSGIFSALRVRAYLSVKNTMRPDELK